MSEIEHKCFIKYHTVLLMLINFVKNIGARRVLKFLKHEIKINHEVLLDSFINNFAICFQFDKFLMHNYSDTNYFLNTSIFNNNFFAII